MIITADNFTSPEELRELLQAHKLDKYAASFAEQMMLYEAAIKTLNATLEILDG